MIRLWVGCSAVAAILGAAAPSGADAPLREDRIRFVVHDLAASQIDATDLAIYLESVEILLQDSQDPAVDVPTCTTFGSVGVEPPVLFTSDGGLANGLAVIENQTELTAVLDWGATQGDRVGIFVQDIQWCGGPSNAIGCAPEPGNVFIVALDAFAILRPLVIAHERGHNAGLSHRSNDSCALMNPVASITRGCLDQGEAREFYDQADVATGEVCECIDVTFHGPNQSWSLVADGTSCDDADLCTATSSCETGLCAGDAPPCSDGDLCTNDLCDPVAGCTNPALPDGAVCDEDGDFCNGIDQCFSGVCESGTPLPCDDGDFCDGVEGCDPQFGCFPGTPPDLDDGVVCTVDSCDEALDVVVHDPDPTSCGDGTFCNGAETCDPQLGCGAGTPLDVDDGIACTNDSCDEDADVVVHDPDAALCDDGDVCTAESCDELTGCASAPVQGCGPQVPAASLAAQQLVAMLLLLSGRFALLRRRRVGSS